MLPADHRLRKPDGFRLAVRAGGRGRSDGIVAHVAARRDGPTQVGFVVGKAVGGAVQRNLVKRRLRAIMASELAAGPSEGEVVVLRALPDSRDSDYDSLARAVSRAMTRARAASRR